MCIETASSSYLFYSFNKARNGPGVKTLFDGTLKNGRLNQSFLVAKRSIESVFLGGTISSKAPCMTKWLYEALGASLNVAVF